MKTIKPYIIPAKPKLVMLTAMAIAVLFSLPRLAVLRHLQNNATADLRIFEFLVRTVYAFVVAASFLLLNLQQQKVKLGYFVYDPASVYQKLCYNIVLFFLLDISFLNLHLSITEPYLREKLFRFLFNMTLILEAILAVFIAHIYRLLFYNQQIKMANEHLLKVNAETRYEMLINQVNPHFLFNSFNTVNALIDTNKQDAIHFINNMSDVFRYMLESNKRDLVTLREEMQFMHAYAGMLKGRYGNKLILHFNISPEAERMLLPPIAIQLLIENAVKHNVISARAPLIIDIFQDGPSGLTVTNPVKEKIIAPYSTGIGLSNLNQRCSYLCNSEITVRRTAREFSVTIPLITPDEYTHH
jgi:two-component system LytT family sensor kinase